MLIGELQKKKSHSQVCLGKPVLSKIKLVIYCRTFQCLNTLMCIENLPEVDGRHGLPRTPMIRKSFLLAAHRDQVPQFTPQEMLLSWVSRRNGGNETNRGGQSHPGPLCSPCLAAAGTQRLEKFLPLHAEVPTLALQDSSCLQLLSQPGPSFGSI